MTDPTVILVDSNIIIDIVSQDVAWAEWSLDKLSSYASPMINPMIFAELCYQKTSADEVDELLEALGLNYEELPKEALFLASRAYKYYRQQRGRKTSPLPDFFIGAHAQAIGVPLLTRDKARYQTYFPNVELVCP